MDTIFKNIVDPTTGKSYDINSLEGKSILNKYIINQKGGSHQLLGYEIMGKTNTMDKNYLPLRNPLEKNINKDKDTFKKLDVTCLKQFKKQFLFNFEYDGNIDYINNWKNNSNKELKDE